MRNGFRLTSASGFSAVSRRRTRAAPMCLRKAFLRASTTTGCLRWRWSISAMWGALMGGGLRSDEQGERTYHLAGALLLAAVGIGASAFLADPVAKMIALTVGSIGVYSARPLLWPLPTAFLAGAAVAPGIAAINAIGNLSGYFGPFIMGWVKDLTGDFRWGLVTIALCALVALVITLRLGHDSELEKAPEPAE